MGEKEKRYSLTQIAFDPPGTNILRGLVETGKVGSQHKEMKNSKTKILLVEDEAITALAMTGALKSMGYEPCKPVATGEKALQSLASENPDVVLMDINLSGNMDGIETASRMMDIGHQAIIFITGYSCGQVYERAKALKPIAIFTKPVNPLDLKTAIDDAVCSAQTADK